MHAQTIRPEGYTGGSAGRFGGITVGDTATERVGFGIERSVAGEHISLDTCFARRGVAAGAGELAGLPRAAIDIAALKRTVRYIRDEAAQASATDVGGGSV